MSRIPLSVGIVGGLGPETTAKFYLEISDYFRDNSSFNPKITIDNCAFPLELEKEIIDQSKNERRLLPFLKRSIMRLNKAGVDRIVIPCNTAHLFIDELLRFSTAKIISIVEETVKEVKKKPATVGILATTKTVKSGLYQNEFEKAGIKCVIPAKKSQKILSKCVLEILEGNNNETKNKIINVANELVDKGAEVLLLACTDLNLAIKSNELSIRSIDTFDVLLKASTKAIGHGGTK